MAVALPFSAAMLLAAWLLLTRVLFPVGTERLLGGRHVIRDELLALGRMTAAEIRMAIIFGVTAILWVTRAPVPGWGWAAALRVDAIDVGGTKVELATDSTVAILMATLCFIVPRGGNDRRTLVTWDMTTRIPWGIILLFGGGFALGAGLQATGLDVYLGNRLARQMDGMPLLGMVALVTTGMTFLTELTSNTASAAMLLPILGGAAGQLEVPPWDLMVPATIAASCAFMLPVATPPNAIVYSAGYVQMRDMIRAGFWLNIIGIFLLVVWMGVA
jgi:sodium-dependent dicarboxylate transporter 2/3/5